MKIISAVLNKDVLTVYDEKGESLEFNPDDAGYDQILKEAVPSIIEKGYYEYEPKEEDSLDSIIGSLIKNGDIAVFNLGSDAIEEIHNFFTRLFGESEEVDIKNKDNEIKDIGRLKKQFSNSIPSTTKFLNRLSKTMDKDVAEDALKFVERGDLPLSDTGTIIAYKIVNTGPFKGTYVDCHTGKVVQKVGSVVKMDESLIDKDRRNECSQGLHVATREYLKNFHGDYALLIEVKPEDIVAVPYGDASKVRVKEYRILAELSDVTKHRLYANLPLDDADDLKLLSRAVAGDFPEPTEETHIWSQDPVYVDIKQLKQEVKEKPKAPIKKAKPLDLKAVVRDEDLLDFEAAVKPAKRLKQLASKPLTKESIAEMEGIRKRQRQSYKSYGLSDELIEAIKKFR